MPLLNDPLYEPTETFTVTLSDPSVPVTIARATGVATILDNPRVDIDPALAGLYVADLNAGPDVSDWLVIGDASGSRSSTPPMRRSTSRSNRSPPPGR